MTLGAVLIAKNEEAAVGRCLASAIAAGVTAVTIVDTGSTDATAEIIETLGFSVHRSSWVNFGHNRSEAFAAARGTADWLLALDADFTVEIDPDFEPDPEVEAYTIALTLGEIDYRLPLLLRGDLPWESRGAVHEYTALPGRDAITRPTDQVRITNHGQQNASVEKSRWHAEMLEAEMAEQPGNSRTVFYLAQTYLDLGDLPRARELYARRATMGGFEEEAWYAQYRAATLAAYGPDCLAALLGAWERRPGRLEPLYDAVKALNERGLHQAAYALALRAPLGPKPPADLLFVHRPVYDWGMDFERSIAEWWVGDRGSAKWQMDQLLSRDLPDHIRAQTEANRAL